MNIWVVGASTGIGESLALELHRQFGHDSSQGQGRDQGNDIFISARNEQKLDAVSAKAGNSLIPISLDITDDWQVNAAVQKISESADTLDLVIINAGTCEYIDSDEIDLETVRNVMETNFFGALSVVNQSLPLLRKSRAAGRSPKLVFVSSSVTYQALPRAGAYGASKAALRYFAESLKIDLQLEGIDVRVVSPGFVETPLTNKNDFPMPFKISADDAARRIVKGLKGKAFDLAFPTRFIWSIKFISYLPNPIKFKLLGLTSRHDVTAVPEIKSSKGRHLS